MKSTEIILNGVQPLRVGERSVGSVERVETSNRTDSIALHFAIGRDLILDAAVDVSEQLACPRVFTIEGNSNEAFVLIGGEKAFWLSIAGAVRAELSLYRKWGDEEYWTMRVIEHRGAILVIYEAGVLAIGPTLEVRWHAPKLFNDELVAVQKDVLKFTRDHKEAWFIRIGDGHISQLGA